MTTKIKNNDYLMTVLSYSPGKYIITIWQKDRKPGVSFEYLTALGLCEVQNIFFSLTNSQCEDILKEKK